MYSTFLSSFLSYFAKDYKSLIQVLKIKIISQKSIFFVFAKWFKEKTILKCKICTLKFIICTLKFIIYTLHQINP